MSEQDNKVVDDTKKVEGDGETPKKDSQQLGGRDKRINELVAKKHELQDKADTYKAKAEELEAELNQARIKQTETEISTKYPNAYNFIKENPELKPMVSTADEFIASMEKLEIRLSKDNKSNDDKPAGDAPETPAQTKPEGDKPEGFVAPSSGEPVVNNDAQVVKNMSINDAKRGGYNEFIEKAVGLIKKKTQSR